MFIRKIFSNINSDPEDGLEDSDTDIAVATVKPKIKKPPLYRVIIFNDDYTPMEFVVFILIEIFHHPPERAERIMLSVHKDGMGVAGIYHLEIAEQKAYESAEEAKEHQYPLKINVEEVQ